MESAGLDIVGLGMSTLDVLMRMGEMPTWETPRRMLDFGLDGGGPVGTACVAAAHLGARVGYVGTVGNDVVGELKMRFMSEHGVDLSRVVQLDEPEAQVVGVYVHEQTGERLFSILDRFYSTQMPSDALDRDYMTSAEFLHLDGFYPDCAIAAARWMHEAGKRVCLDYHRTEGSAIPAHIIELLEHVDILVCGAEVCRGLTGEEDILNAGPAALEMGLDLVVETYGAEGSYSFSGDEQLHTPAFDVDVLDTTGAGDVFHGAYLVGMLRGFNLRQCAEFAAAAAALKCSKLGGRRGIPSFEETVGFLRERGVRVPV